MLGETGESLVRWTCPECGMENVLHIIPGQVIDTECSNCSARRTFHCVKGSKKKFMLEVYGVNPNTFGKGEKHFSVKVMIECEFTSPNEFKNIIDKHEKFVENMGAEYITSISIVEVPE